MRHAERRARRARLTVRAARGRLVGGSVSFFEWREERRSGMELLMGIEPMTSSLPRKCSTAELQQRPTTRSHEHRSSKTNGGDPALASAPHWSGRWESNPRVQLGRLTFYH